MDEHAWQRELEELVRMEARARSILNVGPRASRALLRFAYRRAAMESHPDRKPREAGAQERFKDVVAAYRFLAEGVRDRRLVERRAPREETGGSGYDLDSSWGYFLWWREQFF